MLAKIALFLLKHDKKNRDIVLTEAVKHLFCAISADDILKRNKDGFMEFEGKVLSEGQVKSLKEQADILTNLLIWKVLKKDVAYQLRKKMFEEAVIQGDMTWGRLMTFLWDILETRIEKLK